MDKSSLDLSDEVVSKIDECYRVVDCAICEIDLYEVDMSAYSHKVFIDYTGRVRGGGSGASFIGDQDLTPRQLDPYNSSNFVCGSCLRDAFKVGDEIHAVDRFDGHYAAVYRGTVINVHPSVEKSFDESRYSGAFESIVLGEDNVSLDDGTAMELLGSEEKSEIIDSIFEGESPFECSVIATRHDIWVSEDYDL